ncbi:MAG: hypothetical protein AAF518_24545 [Spirochaetota bacterium]
MKVRIKVLYIVCLCSASIDIFALDLFLYDGLETYSLGIAREQEFSQWQSKIRRDWFWGHYGYSFLSAIAFAEKQSLANSVEKRFTFGLIPVVTYNSFSFFYDNSIERGRRVGFFCKLGPSRDLLFWQKQLRNGDRTRAAFLSFGEHILWQLGVWHQNTQQYSDSKLSFSLIYRISNFQLAGHLKSTGKYSQNRFSAASLAYRKTQAIRSSWQQEQVKPTLILQKPPQKPRRSFPLQPPKYKRKSYKKQIYPITTQEALQIGLPLNLAIQAARASRDRKTYRSFLTRLSSKQRKRLQYLQWKKANKRQK